MTISIEANSIEAIQGDGDDRMQGLKTPAGVKRLPD
jgi:hypothetical protein